MTHISAPEDVGALWLQTLQRAMGREAEAERLFEQAQQLCRSMDLVLPDVHLERPAVLNSS